MKNQDTKKPKPDDLPAFVDAYFSHLQFAPHVPAQFKDYLKGHLHAFALSMRAQYRPAIMVAESTVEDIENFEKKFAVCNHSAVSIINDRIFELACVKGIATIRAIVSEYIVPDSGISAHKAMNEIIGITDDDSVIPIKSPEERYNASGTKVNS